ncbi:MAG TPA: PqqD family peptide modification chaperone [Phycisphaerales bacterium]|nr:PqqD family peptide modification chaperone [Phycisphaerales bacterium]
MALFLRTPESTFSDLWYRIADAKPRVSVHARFVRQHNGPTVSFVVDDPAGGHFYRLSESARYFLGLLDGSRTVDQAWEACLEQLGDEAPTQKECIELLAQMQLFGLLAGDQPIAADMVSERHSMIRKQRLKRRTGNWMFFNIPLINPEPALEALKPYLKPIFGAPGLILWLVTVISAIAVVLTHLERVGSALNGILDPTNLVWLGVLFLVIRTIHELGHAAACKAMGGRCTEIGVMLIGMVLPLPYCDATDSWRFSETWKRVVVAMAGMLVETFFAGLATFVWVLAEPGLARTLAFNIMVISGVSTIFFNANPLLRYDGYYILSDLVGSPNLAQRARALWVYLMHSRVFGVVSARAPYVRDPAELRLLLIYHALALPYRLLISFSILVLISRKYLSLGLVLALFFAVVWLVWPIAKSVWFLLTSPTLMGRRSRAIGATLAMVVPPVVLLGVVPLPASSTLPGVVEPDGMELLRVESPGYVRSVLVDVGTAVRAGDIIAELENPSLVADARAAEARVRYAQAALDEAGTLETAFRRVAEARLERAQAEYEDYARRIEQLSVRANRSGTFAAVRGSGLDVESLPGRFLDRGAVVGVILTPGDVVVRTAITDAKAGDVLPAVHAGSPPTSIRVRGSAGHKIRGTIERVWPAGTHELESYQFASTTGGELLIDPRRQGKTLESFTLVDIKPEQTEGMLPGRRARVRIRLQPRAMLPRYWRRMRQFLEGRRR